MAAAIQAATFADYAELPAQSRTPKTISFSSAVRAIMRLELRNASGRLGISMTARKLHKLAELAPWRQRLREARQRLVVTNGCFDILHRGHIEYLEAARARGDSLLIGLNSDESVLQLKGPQRPLNTQEDRARVLGALECVSAVVIFNEKRANNFLALVEPDLWIKGGDYTLESIDQEERQAVESSGGKIEFIPFVPGKSTTQLVEKIQRL
jgi:rfaE bifunctional protein nucleotidyltransferase chain/domain